MFDQHGAEPDRQQQQRLYPAADRQVEQQAAQGEHEDLARIQVGEADEEPSSPARIATSIGYFASSGT